MKFPVYNCHKQVEAFQIAHITAQAKGTHDDTVPAQQYMLIPREGGVMESVPTASHTEYVLVDKTGEYVAVVGDDYMMRNPVHTGGYFVRYSNGHESFSPQDVFEEGYTLQNLKRVLHIKAGSDNWEPTIEDMQAILDLFMNADADPVGAVVVTNQWIDSTVEKILRTEEHEIVVMRVAETEEEKTEPALGSPIWWETHVWPAGVELPKRNAYEIHLNNVHEQVRWARGRSVNRVVLHGLTEADLLPELASSIHNSTLTSKHLTGKAVEWEVK